LPVFAPVDTVAVICIPEFTMNAAAFTPPKLTLVAPVKPIPVIVTDVPTDPLDAENERIVVKVLRLVSVPKVLFGVVTDTSPVIAAGETTAVI
jgi:hypothetical protein